MRSGTQVGWTCLLPRTSTWISRLGGYTLIAYIFHLYPLLAEPVRRRAKAVLLWATVAAGVPGATVAMLLLVVGVMVLLTALLPALVRLAPAAAEAASPALRARSWRALSTAPVAAWGRRETRWEGRHAGREARCLSLVAVLCIAGAAMPAVAAALMPVVAPGDLQLLRTLSDPNKSVAHRAGLIPRSERLLLLAEQCGWRHPQGASQWKGSGKARGPLLTPAVPSPKRLNATGLGKARGSLPAPPWTPSQGCPFDGAPMSTAAKQCLLTGPTFIRQLSAATCVIHETYGYLPPHRRWPQGAAWVRKGCRAQLRCCATDAPEVLAGTKNRANGVYGCRSGEAVNASTSSAAMRRHIRKAAVARACVRGEGIVQPAADGAAGPAAINVATKPAAADAAVADHDRRWCREAQVNGRVVPGWSWGRLSNAEQTEWMKRRCDRFF